MLCTKETGQGSERRPLGTMDMLLPLGVEEHRRDSIKVSGPSRTWLELSRAFKEKGPAKTGFSPVQPLEAAELWNCETRNFHSVRPLTPR